MTGFVAGMGSCCRKKIKVSWLVAGLLVALLLADSISPSNADQDAKRLYEDLLTDYNRLIRPVGNNSDKLTVKLGLKLSQLIDVVRNIAFQIFLFLHYSIILIFIICD